MNSRVLEKQWNVAPSHGRQNHKHCELARGSRRPRYGRDGKRGRGTKSAMCVGQQLHVVCGAHLQINVGPSAQGHASLGGAALSRMTACVPQLC